MIPQLLVKNKEGIMDIESSLLDLEIDARHISDGITAFEVMVMGLEEAESQYAGGFYAVWKYLSEANTAFQQHLTACLETV